MVYDQVTVYSLIFVFVFWVSLFVWRLESFLYSGVKGMKSVIWGGYLFMVFEFVVTVIFIMQALLRLKLLNEQRYCCVNLFAEPFAFWLRKEKTDPLSCIVILAKAKVLKINLCC